jgi:hypothetical protein
MFESKQRAMNMPGEIKEVHKVLKFEKPCRNGSHFKFYCVTLQ